MTKSLRERQRNFTRAQLMASCLELFNEKGYTGTSVEELAERSNCAKGTVYAHFPGGKDEILREIYRDLSEDFNRDLDEIAAAYIDDTPTLIRAVVALGIKIAEQPVRGKFFMVDGPALAHVMRDTKGIASRHIVEVLIDGISRADKTATVDAEPVALLIVGLVREAGARVAAGEIDNPSRLLSAVDQLVRGSLSN